jgi:hypothetical protein
MVSTRNKTVVKQELINYISSLGLKVNTVTKARGNKGFFKEGRIDISKTLDDEMSIRTLVHEYAHFVNYKLDKKIKNLEILFKTEPENIIDELIAVTNRVDENSLCLHLHAERNKLKAGIKKLSDSIKVEYPDFKSTEDFKPFKRYSRWSNVNYLEKYDRVKLHTWFSSRIYSISNVRKDFPDIPDVFVNYLKLRSKQRKCAKISRRISKLNKYYAEPCELFARFVEGIYIDIDLVKELAPTAFECFYKLYNDGYYVGLREIYGILEVSI